MKLDCEHRTLVTTFNPGQGRHFLNQLRIHSESNLMDLRSSLEKLSPLALNTNALWVSQLHDFLSEILSKIVLVFRNARDYAVVLRVWDNGRSEHKRVFPNTHNEVPRWGADVCLWLLIPEVVMTPLVTQARSVILASGTLSPMNSMQVCD